MARWGVGGEISGTEEVGGEIREGWGSCWDSIKRRLVLKGASSCNEEVLTTYGFGGRIRDAKGEDAFFQGQFALK